MITPNLLRMPRINIEENFWTDPRFRYLVKLVGCEFKAIGMCLTLWKIGQECYKRGVPISEEMFEFAGLTDHIIKAKLAIRVDGGFQAKGAEEHFGWLKTLVESGRKGGLKTQELQRNKNSKIVQANASEALANVNPLTLPLTLTLKEEGEYVGSNEPTQPALLKSEKQKKLKDIEKEFKTIPTLGEIWNEFIKHPLRPIVSCEGKRGKFAKARWAAKPRREYWQGLIERINTSRFCKGENDRKWVANFDWFLQEDVPQKILEGKYDNEKPLGQLSPMAREFERQSQEKK